MSNSNISASSGGVSFGGALFFVFLVLKLTGHITWAWWWVASPLWIPFAIVLIAIVIPFVLALIATVILAIVLIIREIIKRWKNVHCN